jgi:signal transduction histidine kinase
MRRNRSLEAPPGPIPERRRSRLLLERLLRAEARARRQRRAFALLVVVGMAGLAAADAWWWQKHSLAAGYILPITAGAYAFGIRTGVALAFLAVVLRYVCAGGTHDLWWVYAGSPLMLAEYLVLAVGVGLAGRAVRRLERQGRLLRLLNAHGRALASALDTVVVERMGVEAAIELAGADGGLVAEAEGAVWKAQAIWRDGGWEERPITWTSESPELPAPLLRPLGAEGQLALRVPGARPLAIVVYRASPEPFAEMTREVLELFVLRVAAALSAADRYRAAVHGTHEKAQMLARVAHEMATPLHVILGLTDVLEARTDAIGREALVRLQRHAQILRTLTASLLDFSRAEASLPAARREPIHVPALYERARDAAVALVGRKAVRVDVVVENGAEWVESDPEMLRQIVTNLATNAAKYTPEGRVELRATRSNGEVFLAVSDTGIGIPESEHELIFEPFYRSPNVGGESGVGLGLALVRDLGHLLDTRVVVRSQEGVGATFSLAVPATERSASGSKEMKEERVLPGHH